jgi:Dynamin GTPase effector domain
MHWALQAYLKVAMKRICDTVPITLDTEFIKKVLESVREKLVMGGVTDETLVRVVMEDFDVTNKRRETIACQEALLQAKKEIVSFSLSDVKNLAESDTNEPGDSEPESRKVETQVKRKRRRSRH